MLASPRVSYLIKWVERGVRAELDSALKSLDVSTPEYTALSVLSHRGGLSSAQLARRAFVSAQAMNQIVVSLERSGWLERTPDPENARVLRAHLTRAGRAILVRCDQVTANVERALLARLSEQDTDQLRALLDACASALTRNAESVAG